MLSTQPKSEMSTMLRVMYHAPEYYFKIPKDWKLKDIEIRWGQLFYKGELQDDIEEQEMEPERKRPLEMDIVPDEEAEGIISFFMMNDAE